MTSEEARESLPLYAIGALDSAAAREIGRQIDDLPEELRAEARAMREIAALLPLALPAVDVPEGVKPRLLREVERMSREAGAAGVVGIGRGRRRIAWPQAALLAASMIIALTSALTAGLMWRENQRLEAEASRLAAENEVLRGIASEQRELEQLIGSASRLIAFEGQAAAREATGRLLWDTERARWAVVVEGLPRARADREYQLWYITKDQRKISARLFSTDEAGRSQLRIEVPRELTNDLAAAAVTLEPRGGSPQPTGEIYLLAAL